MRKVEASKVVCLYRLKYATRTFRGFALLHTLRSNKVRTSTESSVG